MKVDIDPGLGLLGDWSDGSKLWTPDMMKTLDHSFGDYGVFWISYTDFLKHFASINRVRLFNKEWYVPASTLFLLSEHHLTVFV